MIKTKLLIKESRYQGVKAYKKPYYSKHRKNISREFF